MAQNSEIWGVKKNLQLFDIDLKNYHFMAQQMANRSHIQKSTSRYVEHPRLHLLGQIGESWVPFKASQMLKNAIFFSTAPSTPLSVSHPPKMVPSCSLVICPPKTPSIVDHWWLLHQENLDFLRAPYFGKSTQMALGLPKVDICQKWP